MNDKQPQSNELLFDPTNHPDDSLKAFNEFVQTFQLRYAAQFPDPPKVSLDAAINRWKIANTTELIADPKPTLAQYDQVVADWQSKDKVAKFLGMFTSKHFYNDWVAAQPDETLRNNAGWADMIGYMKEYYKPTENLTLKNFHFRSLAQESGKTFAAFCNEVDKEAKNCSFKCHHPDCTAESTAVRDQIVYGTTNDKIREEALIRSWDLPTLWKEGMHMERAAKGAAELAGEPINRMGSYLHKNLRTKQPPQHKQPTLKPITCFNCGNTVTTPIKTHVRKECPAIGKHCHKCGNVGHFPQCCKKHPEVNQVQQQQQSMTHSALSTQTTVEDEQTYIFSIDSVQITDTEDVMPTNDTNSPNMELTQEMNTVVPTHNSTTNSDDNATGLALDTHQGTDQPSEDTENTYNINVFLVKSQNRVLPKLKSNLSSDFRALVVINNAVDKPLANTGAKVSVSVSMWNCTGPQVKHS